MYRSIHRCVCMDMRSGRCLCMHRALPADIIVAIVSYAGCYYGGLFFFAVVLRGSPTAEQRGNYGWEHHQAELRRVHIGGMLFDEKGDLANELHGRKCAIIIKDITSEECRLEFADRNGLVQAIFEARVDSRRIQRMPGNIFETESQARCSATRWVAALSKPDNKARLAPGSRHYRVVVFNEGGDERYLFGREGYSPRTASALGIPFPLEHPTDEPDCHGCYGLLQPALGEDRQLLKVLRKMEETTKQELGCAADRLGPNVAGSVQELLALMEQRPEQLAEKFEPLLLHTRTIIREPCSA